VREGRETELGVACAAERCASGVEVELQLSRRAQRWWGRGPCSEAEVGEDAPGVAGLGSDLDQAHPGAASLAGADLDVGDARKSQSHG
jgi:hypothetical protein